MNNWPRSTCPVCDSDNLTDFLEIEQVPVYCNVLWASRSEALAAPKGDLALAFCPACGHVFNRKFDPALVEYTGEYENSLHYSPRFQQYAEGLARDLVERYALRNKDIVEIACGKGDFLKLLCEMGGNRGFGFDPSYDPDREELGMSTDLAGGGKLQFIRDYYGDDYVDHPADFICCRHALEHIPAATQFLKGLRRGVGNRKQTVIFFEVPNSLFSLRDLGIWDFIYEHPSFFSAPSLAGAFRLAGFDVRTTRETFGGQYLCVEAVPLEEATVAEEGEAARDGGLGRTAMDYPLTVEEREQVERTAGLVRVLPSRFGEIGRKWRRELDELARERRQAAIWGGGSKGVTFLNIMKAGTEVPYVVDINPHKQGKYVPGTGQRVVPPEALCEDPPHRVIVMNPLYREEIAAKLRELGLDSEVDCVGG